MQETVDAAKALGERARPFARGLLGEQVDDAGVDPVLAEAEVFDHGVEPFLVDVGEREARAVVGEAAGDRRAEAAGGAGDRNDASVESSHRSSVAIGKICP